MAVNRGLHIKTQHQSYGTFYGFYYYFMHFEKSTCCCNVPFCFLHITLASSNHRRKWQCKSLLVSQSIPPPPPSSAASEPEGLNSDGSTAEQKLIYWLSLLRHKLAGPGFNYRGEEVAGTVLMRVGGAEPGTGRQSGGVGGGGRHLSKGSCLNWS